MEKRPNAVIAKTLVKFPSHRIRKKDWTQLKIVVVIKPFAVHCFEFFFAYVRIAYPDRFLFQACSGLPSFKIGNHAGNESSAAALQGGMAMLFTYLERQAVGYYDQSV